MSLLHDLAEFNRKLFTRWSFINNRKLILLWCNGIVIFYLLSLISRIAIYSWFTLILSVVFLVIELGEMLSQKRPKTESESKDRKINIFSREITIKKRDKVEVIEPEPEKTYERPEN